MRIALISLDQAWNDKDTNFLRCTEFVKLAADRGCSLIVFPEMTLTGYSFDLEISVEKGESSETLARFCSLAEDNDISVVFGAALSQSGVRFPLNTLCLANNKGEGRAVYSKVHLFSFAGEDSVFSAGEHPAIINVSGFRFLTSICYDLRFPEIYSMFADKVDAAIVIANWPARRVSHWRTLMVARAIENQSYMIGVNRIGQDGNNLVYEKSSMLVSPDGNILSPEIVTEELDIYEIDQNEVECYRASFPTVKDKRFDVYRRMADVNGTC